LESWLRFDFDGLQDLSTIATRASLESTPAIRSLSVCGEDFPQNLPSTPPYKHQTPLLTSSPGSNAIGSMTWPSTYVTISLLIWNILLI